LGNEFRRIDYKIQGDREYDWSEEDPIQGLVKPLAGDCKLGAIMFAHRQKAQALQAEHHRPQRA
jgi:hypothetical protein